MKATIVKPAENARNLEPAKERVKTLRVVSTLQGKTGLHTVCEARFYMARRSDGASPVYCSLWVHGAGIYCGGYGKASGYGYHKESAALQAAIDSAGIRLTGDNYRQAPTDAESTQPARIDGCGSSAMNAAMRAIASAVGADPACMLVE